MKVVRSIIGHDFFLSPLTTYPITHMNNIPKNYTPASSPPLSATPAISSVPPGNCSAGRSL